MRLIIFSIIALITQSAFAVEEIIKLVENGILATESMPEVQIKQLDSSDELVTYWLKMGELQNELDVIKGDFLLVDCGNGRKAKISYSEIDLKTKSRLVIVASSEKADVDSRTQEMVEGIKKENNKDKKDNAASILLNNFGKVFQGETKDGRKVYGIVSEDYGEYKVVNGDKDANAAVSKEFTGGVTKNFYAKTKLETGAVIFYDKLLKAKSDENLETPGINDLVQWNSAIDIGGGSKHKINDIEKISVEVFSHFETGEDDSFGFEHKYNLVRGKYERELSEDLALVAGVTVANQGELLDILSISSSLKGSKQSLIVEFSDHARLDNINDLPTTTVSYQRKLNDNLEMTVSGLIPMDEAKETAIRFTIKKAF